MRVLITGQIGLDKKHYIESIAALARASGEEVKVFHIGDMMYREAPDVRPGRILDLPLARLNQLRRSVMRDVIAESANHKHVIVNTHATFRWKHGLFSAFDFDQLATFNADLYITLVDNIETVHQRMVRDHDLEHSLKDLMVWREEEILATELCAKAHTLARSPAGADPHAAIAPAPKFFVLSRGRHAPTCETAFRLIFRPNMRKVYPSFPMSHVMDLPETLAEINDFRARMAKSFITFDPGDVDEKLLADSALAAARHGQQFLDIPPLTGAPHPTSNPNDPHEPGSNKLPVREVMDIVGDIDGQIYARDFLLVRQSDMIVSYIPELPTGKPGLSSGVERELQHAHEHAKDVFVIWKPRKDPSPFITQTANKVFRSVDEALTYFDQRGFCVPYSLFGT